MKQLLTIILLVFATTTYSQCVSNQSTTITPLGPYEPGDVVTVTYTLGNFTGIFINWIHAFEINLSPSWINLTPITTPLNPAGSAGNWVWDIQHTFIGGLNFGPGWRFDNTANVDWGTASTGPFTMSFTVEVAPTCTADILNISMLVIDDCTTGGWTGGGGACCVDPAFQIYNGNVLPDLISTSLIYHY
tara:strand:- start:1197 stop:1763 length:567 start_codon:yes stop_codon:yes gene_type:complete